MTKPLVPPEVDLRDFPHMQLDVAKLINCDFTARASAQGWQAAVLLWCWAWHQVPCASLPDCDAILARHAGFGRDMEMWAAHRDEALDGFVLCDDGRLYHPFIANKALAAWEKRVEHKKRGASGAAKRWNKKKPEDSESIAAADAGSNPSTIDPLVTKKSRPASAPAAMSVADADMHFEASWSAYPSLGSRSNPRKPAREKFVALVRYGGVDPSAILEGIKRYAASRPEAQYTSQMIVFLNQERFNDSWGAPARATRHADDL